MFPYFVIDGTFDHDVDEVWFLCVSLNNLAFLGEIYYPERFVESGTHMLIDDVEKSEWTVDHLVEEFELGFKKLAVFWESLE